MARAIAAADCGHVSDSTVVCYEDGCRESACLKCATDGVGDTLLGEQEHNGEPVWLPGVESFYFCTFSDTTGCLSGYCGEHMPSGSLLCSQARMCGGWTCDDCERKGKAFSCSFAFGQCGKEPVQAVLDGWGDHSAGRLVVHLHAVLPRVLRHVPSRLRQRLRLPSVLWRARVQRVPPEPRVPDARLPRGGLRREDHPVPLLQLLHLRRLRLWRARGRRGRLHALPPRDHVLELQGRLVPRVRVPHVRAAAVRGLRRRRPAARV